VWHSRPRLWVCSKARGRISDHPITRSPDFPITRSPISRSPISDFRSPDHRSPDHQITRSPDFRNVPRSYHTSITRQSNLKFTHTDHGDSLQPKSERTRTTQRCDPELPTPYMPHQGVSTRSMEFWFGFGFCQLPIANCHLQPFANCQLPLLANCH
jgi:hypothetical protein